MFKLAININLLEEKETSHRLPGWILSIGAGISLLIGLGFWIISIQISSQITEVEKVLQDTKEKQTTFQVNSADEVFSKREELTEAVDSVEKWIFPARSLVEQLISLLPERGFIESYTYTSPGQVNVTVRFDSLQEVASYTDALERAPYISEINVDSIVTRQMEENLNRFEYRPRYIASFIIKVGEPDTLSEMGVAK